MFFSNWSATHSFYSDYYHEPKDDVEIVQILQLAASENAKVKVIGALHSPSDIFSPLSNHSCHVIYLGKYMNKVLQIDTEAFKVRVQAGATLSALNSSLQSCGLRLANLASISDQTIAGALATGTHGTGLAHGIFSTHLLEVQLIQANDFSLHTYDRSTDPELFSALQCSLGALGVWTTLTLSVVRNDYFYQSIDTPIFHAWESTVAEMPNVAATLSVEHVKYLWYPLTDHIVFCRTFEDQHVPLSHPNPSIVKNASRSFTFSSLFSSHVYELGEAFMVRRVLEWLLWLALFFPFLTGWINSLYFFIQFPVTKQRMGTNVEMLSFNCMFQQYAVEWSIPIEDLPAVLTAFKQGLSSLVQFHQVTPDFPIEIRFAAADDILVSPCYGRSSCYVGIISYKPFGKDVAFEAYQRYFESILLEICPDTARPHWGKPHSMKPADLKRVYPKLGTFLQLRKKMDPSGLFLNDYLIRHLLTEEDYVQ